jgi:DNA-binding MarR family transcriptional regulator
MASRAGTHQLPDADRLQSHPDEHLTDFAGYNLKRLFTLVQNDLARELAELDLRIISYSVLSVVVHNPGINQTRVAEALKLERSNLVQIVDELASRGLLARAPIENNKRSHALVPTPEGSALVDTADEAVTAHEARMFANLSITERATLNRLLLKVRRANEQ